ncbi:MAG: aspartate aminotransferase family protein [Bdellovibrionales bacterium]|nr:aspartate aminotransferase family protein [Bdellovibrionales bacterium]
MKKFDLDALLSQYRGKNYQLHAQHINPAFAKVLKIIGFDRCYTSGQGAYLYDQEGTRYLDFLAGYGVFNLGRNHPYVNDALKQLLSQDYPNLVKMAAPELSGILAKMLIERMPEGLDRVYFGSSGSEAVESALKFCRVATGRDQTLYLQGSYHGLTYGSLAVTGDSHFRRGFEPMMPGSIAIARNDMQALERELSTKKYASLILEPIQGKGVYVLEDTFLMYAKELCQKYGTYLIADEIQSGMGRSGKFLAIGYSEVQPDLVLLSKSLSGGQVPVSAVIGKAEIFDRVFSSLDRCVVHSNTFSQNAMAMVAGIASLEVLENEGLIQQAYKMGQLLQNGLKQRRERFELLGEVRGRGLMLGVEFSRPRSLRLKLGWDLLHKADAGLFSQAIVMPLMDQHSILTQVAGHNMDVIKLSPPLCLDTEDVDYFLSAFDQVMEDCHRFPGPIWDVGSRLVRHSLKKEIV